jgi:hypothetical protein
VAFAGLASLASGVILYLGRGSFFYFDEWTWIVERRDWSTSTFLRPHNEHLSAVPIAIYKLLFATVGLAHYWPYRAILVAIHLCAALAVYLIARRRLGPWLALAPATILLFLGAAHEDLMWPFQMGFIGATAAGAWALWALDRNTRRADLLAAIALTVSLGCASPGIPMVVAAFVELVWRRATWRRLWVVGIPVAVYLAWYAAYSPGEPIKPQNVAATAEYMASSAAASVAALTGLDFNAWGRALAVAAAIAVVWRLRAAPAVATPRLAGALGGALAFWALTGVARADIVPVGASRYTYGGALLLLLAAVELVQGGRIGSRTAAIAIVAAVAFASLAGYGQLYAEGRNHQVIAKDLEVELTALDLARANVAPDLQWDPVRMPTIAAGTYFAAVDDLGSPAPPLAQVRLDPEPRRLTFDRMSQSLDHARLDAAAPGTPGHESVVAGPVGAGAASRRHGCVVYSPAPQGGTIQVRVPAEGLLITVDAKGARPVDVAVRRLADEFGPTIGQVWPAAPARLSVDRDTSPDPWWVLIGAYDRVSLCSDVPPGH